MFGYILVAIIGILIGGTAEHSLDKSEAREEREKSQKAEQDFIEHLESMKDKSVSAIARLVKEAISNSREEAVKFILDVIDQFKAA